VIARTLELRAALPSAFAGSYESVEAGTGVCRFRRGEVEVDVPLSPAAAKDGPSAGRRDLFRELEVGLYAKS
jgi:hypothetical protein